MPEPDFDQIARKILRQFDDPTDPLWRSSLQMAAEQLRQVWNARGAADIAKAEYDSCTIEGDNWIERAIRSLDR